MTTTSPAPVGQTAGTPGRKESNMDFSTIPHGCLEEGTETRLGIIEAVSLTAYLIAGRWVPFRTIHGERPRAEALAIPQGLVDEAAKFSGYFEAASAANIRAMLAGGAK